MDSRLRDLQRKIESSDPEVRIAATRQLAALSEPCMPLFALSLGDSDWRVRKAAIETFYQLDLPATFIPELIEFLTHPENAGLRNAAIEILIGLGPLAVPVLQAKILEADAEVRKFVIDILGEIGDPNCAAELICALNDKDTNVRYAAVETVGKLKLASAVEPLLDLMPDSDQGLKFTILSSLAQIGGLIPTERLLPYLKDRLLHKSLFECFAIIGGAEVIPPLVGGLTDPVRQVREAALSALDVLRLRDLGLIKEALTSVDTEQIAVHMEEIIRGENLSLKGAAITFLGYTGSSADPFLLLSMVADESLRLQTLNALAELGEDSFRRISHKIDASDLSQLQAFLFIGGELGYFSALPLAMEAVCSVDPQLRNIATRVIGELGGAEQVVHLQRLLGDDIPEIQDTAALAMAAAARRHRNRVLDTVLILLSDANPEIRMRAVRILGLIGGEGIETQLSKAFKDSSVLVRCEAVRAFGGYSGEIATSALTLALTDESPEVRRLAVTALGSSSQENALSALALACGDDDFWVRAAVMRVLAQFSGETVRHLLLQGVSDPIGLVAISALESSAVALPEESLSLLESALNHADQEVVKAAMTQLSRVLGNHWPGPLALDLLNHPHWDVRLQAVRLLAQSGGDEVLCLLNDRLAAETEVLVIQAIDSAISGLRRIDRQGC